MARTYSPADETYLSGRARKAFHYHPDTGMLRWRVGRQGGYALPGAPAGSIGKDGSVRVCLDGENYSAARLVYLYQLGYFPTHRMVFQDGNKQNLAWDNIRHDRGDFSHTRVAAYHRELRALNREIETRIANGDHAGQAALAAGGKEARAVRAYWREIIREERAAAGVPTRRQRLTEDTLEVTSKRFGAADTWREGQ